MSVMRNLRSGLRGAAVSLVAVFISASGAAPASATVSPVVVQVMAAETDAGRPISRAQILARAEWALDNHPSAYTHSRAAWGPEQDIAYTGDCSGLVSMAWHLPRMLSSASLPGVTTEIAVDELRAGDILDIPGTHVILFGHWLDDTGTFDYYTYGSYPPKRDVARLDDPVIDGHPTNLYRAFRYNLVVSDEVTDYAIAYRAENGKLQVADAIGEHTQAMAVSEVTSPAIAARVDGGWVVAAQTPQGTLGIVADGIVHTTRATMRSRTSPAVAASPRGGFEVVYQSATGHVVTYNSSGESLDLSHDIRDGANPAIAPKPDGGYVIAYQSSASELIVVDETGTHGTGLLMMDRTTPAVATSGTDYRILVQAPTGHLMQYDSQLGVTDLDQPMMGLTSPAITALPGGGYQAAFQARTGELVVTGDAIVDNLELKLKGGSSPAIAATDSGFRVVAYGANNTLWSYDTAVGLVDEGQVLRPGAGTAISSVPAPTFTVAPLGPLGLPSRDQVQPGLSPIQEPHRDPESRKDAPDPSHPSELDTQANDPSDDPTDGPTDTPTDEPTDQPTDTPTDQPTDTPTDQPTDTPTGEPTDSPTGQPTDTPTDGPTEESAPDAPTEPLSDQEPQGSDEPVSGSEIPEASPIDPV